jgi:hypothetical protein
MKQSTDSKLADIDRWNARLNHLGPLSTEDTKVTVKPDYRNQHTFAYADAYRKIRKARVSHIPPEVIRIKRQLARVNAPAEIKGAEDIGHGVEKHAYRVGAYVVKELTEGSGGGYGNGGVLTLAKARRIMRAAGITPIPQWTCKGFVIQPYATPLKPSRVEHGECCEMKYEYGFRMTRAIGKLDCHCANLGVIEGIGLVAFDW